MKIACDDLWRNFIRRRKTVIFLNSYRMCCACSYYITLHYITLQYYNIQPTPRWVFSVTDYIRHYNFSCYLLSMDYSSLQQLKYYSLTIKKYKTSETPKIGNIFIYLRFDYISVIIRIINLARLYISKAVFI